ncbi:hypothetical protein HPB48_010464 [Haemaphysalis longicornis]|uniref:L-serine ammonia-lyase n=1 Tax=Haemaphysalis longicornis TaxID=44386 RepID=A0A9J6GU65_HAELO|nr:hypothetical protein HPB48_010464 [Haemaphysalis longicornis]
MVPEIKSDLREEVPAAIVASVGGGGLVCGLSEGMDAVGWGHVPILAVETKGADSFRASLTAGTHVTLPKITRYAPLTQATWHRGTVASYGCEKCANLVT